jgi:elongation factor G
MTPLSKARITRPAKGEGKYAKQTGGRGQYGHVKIYIYPGVAGSGFVFENEIPTGLIPNELIPVVEQGLRHAAKVGVPEGNAIDDVRVVLEDGSYHDVDSTAVAVRIAATMAFHDAVSKAGPVVDSSGDDDTSFVRDPTRPSRPRPDSAIALPEPDDD